MSEPQEARDARDALDVESDEELEDLLGFLRDARGFDFTGYKRSSLGWRIRKRMADVDTSTYADYRDRLEANADEFGALFNTILINVTSFFRDPGGEGTEGDASGEGGAGLNRDSLDLGRALAEVAGNSLLRERELDRSHTHTAQLEHALTSRIVIEQAKGVVSTRHAVPMAEAFELLRCHARSNRQMLAEVARAVVEGRLEVGPPAPGDGRGEDGGAAGTSRRPHSYAKNPRGPGRKGAGRRGERN